MLAPIKKILVSKYFSLALIVLAFILIYRLFDINLIKSIILDRQFDLQKNNLITIITIFFLRFVSIIFPILPGTYCSVLAGYLFGFDRGIIIIFFADFLSCSVSFLIARKLGREFVMRFLGSKQMNRVERISHNFIENNFFLMTASLMTQFFDFVCYAIGLTKVSWKKFMPALILSILISDSPFVAGGYALKDIKEISLNQIINGEVNLLYGNYLIIFIISIVSIFALGILNIVINKRSTINN